MTNIREEFERTVKGKEVSCCELYTRDVYFRETLQYYRLKRDYTPEDYEYFLQSINKRYDSGFGRQELYGYIWFTDGTWAERGEYDGSEWWVIKECPAIPEYL